MIQKFDEGLGEWRRAAAILNIGTQAGEVRRDESAALRVQIALAALDLPLQRSIAILSKLADKSDCCVVERLLAVNARSIGLRVLLRAKRPEVLFPGMDECLPGLAENAGDVDALESRFTCLLVARGSDDKCIASPLVARGVKRTQCADSFDRTLKGLAVLAEKSRPGFWSLRAKRFHPLAESGEPCFLVGFDACEFSEFAEVGR